MPEVFLLSRTLAGELNSAPAVASQSDAALLARAAARDEDACKELLKRYGQRLLKIVEAVHRDHGLAEDVVQEAFLRAIQNHQQLRTKESFFPWLVRIGMRLAVDQRRKTQREAPSASPRKLVENQGLAETDLSTNPERCAADKEDSARLKSAVDSLNERDRELLLLRYYGSFSVAELAQTLGKNEAAVRKELERARGRLRHALKDWFEG